MNRAAPQGLQQHLDALERQHRRRFVLDTRWLRLGQRLDPVLLVLLGALLLSATLVLAVSLFVADRLGCFEPELVRPVPDRRRLVNLRSQAELLPFLDAAFHEPDACLYLSQLGGRLHRYDPATELWQTGQPLVGNDDISSNLVLLRSGCGDDPQAGRSCPDPRSLWGVSDRGGLARRRDEGWQVLIGDTSFVGVGGELPSGEQLRCAAVSGDGQWLLLGTGGSGVGLYRPQAHSWTPLGDELQSSLPALTSDHIRWWRDRFWIGGAQGLGTLTPRLSGSEGGSIPAVGGTIVDLDADDVLLVLEELACANDPGLACRRLSLLRRPGGEPQLLLDERNRYPDLELAGLGFAAQQGEVLMVAGEAGLLSFDTRLHTWQQHRLGPVWPVMADSRGALVGVRDDTVVRLAGDHIETTWTLEEQQRLVSLADAGSGEVIAMSQEGDLLSLQPDGKLGIVLTASSTGHDPGSFTQAVRIDNAVVLFGTQGTLVHDVVARSYLDAKATGWGWDSVVVASGESIYGVPRAGGRVWETKIPALLNGVRQTLPGTLPGSPSAIKPWQEDGIGVVAGGRAYRVDPHGAVAITGEPYPEPRQQRFNDVVVGERSLVVATDSGLRRYDLMSRSWNASRDHNTAGAIAEVEQLGDELLVRTTAGRLVRTTASSVVLDDDTPEIAIPDGDLSDAMVVESQLYLAGGGRIVHYDPRRRTVAGSWLIPEEQPIELIGLLEGQPLALSGGSVYRGQRTIDAEAGRVLGLFIHDDTVWTLRETGDALRYLKGYAAQEVTNVGLARCFARTPLAFAPDEQVLDAVTLSANRMLVASTAGLRLYDSGAGSWFTVVPRSGEPPSQPAAAVRLSLLGPYLVIIADERLAICAADQLSPPDSCSTQAITPTCFLSATIRAATIDEQQGRVAWISADGSAHTWNDGRMAQLLGPVTPIGPLRSMRRIYRDDNALLLAGGTGVWRYDLATFQASLHRLGLAASAAVADINLEQEGQGVWMVTVHTTDGAALTGILDPEQAEIQLQQVLPPRRERGAFGFAGERIIDAAKMGSRWAMVLDDRIRTFHPIEHRWSDEVVFSRSDPTTSLCLAGSVLVVVRDGGATWWIRRSLDTLGDTGQAGDERYTSFAVERPEQTVIDSDGAVWTLEPDGSVSRWTSDGGSETHIGPAPQLETDQVLAAYRIAGAIVLQSWDGGFLAFDAMSRKPIELPEQLRGDPEQATATLRNVWPELGRWCAPDGRLDPVVELRLERDGESLVLVRRSGEVRLLAKRAWRRPPRAPELNEGWLGWSRNPQRPGFLVRTADGVLELSTADFVVGDRMPFDEITAVLARSQQRLLAATPRGVLESKSGSLRLDDPAVRFRPVDLGPEIIAAHGRFLTPTGSMWVDAGSLQPDRYPVHELSVGRWISFQEQTRTGSLSGFIERGGDRRPLTTGNSGLLPWDRRYGAAFDGDGVLVLSGLGLHRPDLDDPATTIEPMPGRQVESGGDADVRLANDRHGLLCCSDGADWFRRRRDRWVRLNPLAVASSGIDRSAQIDQTGETLSITTATGDRLQLHRHREGYAEQRLLAATSHQGRLWLMSDRGLSAGAAATGWSGFADGMQVLAAAQPCDRLDSVAMSPGAEHELQCRQGNQARTWQGSERRFVSNPDSRRRVHAATDRLRFSGSPAGGRGGLVKELRVDTLNGGSAWQRFSFCRGWFPFDRVQEIETAGDRLFVVSALGSPAGCSGLGLQVLDAWGDGGLDNMVGLLDLGDEPAGVQLVRPPGSPDELVVRGRGCRVWRDGTLVPCTPALVAASTEHLLGENGLWRWTRDERGRVSGRYRQGQGFGGSAIELQDGFLPHDRLRCVMGCRGRAAAVWQDGRLTVHPNEGNLGMAAAGIVSLPEGRARDLLCVTDDAVSEEGLVEPGLYVVGDDPAGGQPLLWRLDEDQPEQVTAPRLLDLLRRYHLDPPVLRMGRLRLPARPPRGEYRFEYLSSTDGWQVLPWISNRVAIDKLEQVAVLGDTIWAATPVGLVSFQRGSDGKLRLDPATLRIVPTPCPADTDCSTTELEPSGDGLRLRYNHDSRLVFTMSLGEAGDGELTPLGPGAADPFAERRLVATGYWEWWLVDHSGGRRGSLKPSFRGEPLGLAGGRFDLAAPTSLALFHDGLVDLAIEGSGWYQAPRDDLSLAVMTRPDPGRSGGLDPQSLTRVGVSVEDGRRLLSLGERGGARVALLADDGSVEWAQEPSDHLGSDGLWRYARAGEDLVITATGLAGDLVNRRLVNGRFTDDLVLGPPVTGLRAPESEAEGDNESTEAAVLFSLVPTEAGLLRLDRDGRVSGIASVPGESGIAAVTLEPQGPVVVNRDHFISFLAGEEEEPIPEECLPEGARVSAVEHAAGGVLRLVWRLDAATGWSLLELGEGGVRCLGTKLLHADCSTWQRFHQHRVPWGDPSPILDVELLSDHLRVTHVERPQPLLLPWSRELQPVAVVRNDELLFVVETGEISEVNLDVALHRLLGKD